MQPDYEMDEVFEFTTPEQLKAMGDAFRQKILRLLGERAATIQELAAMLDTPTSTVAHHLQVLTDAGITKVVRTRQVRALTQRYYGCTARNYISISSVSPEYQTATIGILSEALKNIATDSKQGLFLASSLSHARIPLSQVHAFIEQVQQLSKEFEALDTPEGVDCNFLTVIYQM
jgi:DNA-binding transcriptional ArsR family regulator